MRIIVNEGEGKLIKDGSTNDYPGLPWGKTWLKKHLSDMRKFPNGTFHLFPLCSL